MTEYYVISKRVMPESERQTVAEYIEASSERQAILIAINRHPWASIVDARVKDW